MEKLKVDGFHSQVWARLESNNLKQSIDSLVEEESKVDWVSPCMAPSLGALSHPQGAAKTQGRKPHLSGLRGQRIKSAFVNVYGN